MQQYDMLLLRFGEITIKGKNRFRFEKAVLAHIHRLISPFPGAETRQEFGRVYVILNGHPADKMIAELKHVFGIVSISPVRTVPSQLDDIITEAVTFVKESIPARESTFKVTSRRVWKGFLHSSPEMNQLVSKPILSATTTLKVDVVQPELNLRIEIRENETYLYSDTIKAAGGFPLGTNGKGMLLLSGGIDSPVAGWSAMRRGLEVECIHFHSYPFTSKKAEEKVLDLASVLAGYGGQMKVHLVPFTEIQTMLSQAGHDNLIITLMRRAMLRIATQLAEKNGALALVTGDSLGQVASQTLSSMNVIGRATDLPLLRPLITNDKDDIIATAHEIGTYDISILPYEDCCTLFIPKSPATNPNLRMVERIELGLSPRMEELIEEAIRGTEVINIVPGEKITRSSDQEQTTTQEQWF